MLMLVSAAFLPLSGCAFLETLTPKSGDRTDIIDRQQKLSVDDFRNLNHVDKLKKPSDEPTATAALGVPPVPDLAQVLAAPKAPKVANTKLVTLSVTEDVPLRDVLFELGRLANVDIEIGSGLDGNGINLRATDRPFNEVIERIAHLANLRYSVSGNSIRVERDLPYIKNYSIDFLNTVRSTTSTYNLSTNILSGGGGAGGGTATGFGTTGSTNNITSTGESDLFSSLEASISEIINFQPGGAVAGAAGDGQKTAAGGAGAGNGNFVVNRQSNVLTVNATEAQHEMIQRFLALMSRNASAQVLIEAKIVEVSLADAFLSGVDWSKVLGGTTGITAEGGTFVPTALTTNSPFKLGVKNGDLDYAISLTEKFGTTRTLSSPRLSAINNQQAVLTFARNTLYYECEAQAGEVIANTGTTGATAAQPSVTCKQNIVPIGIILSILPSINLNTQEITLNVRPTLTRQVGTVQNPSIQLAAAVVAGSGTPLDLEDTVPVIEVRELDSIMKVKSGGVMVIGGLMEDSTRNEHEGIPGAQELPMVGNLFKSRNEDSLKRELIIFIKATIVNSDGSAHKVDHTIYDTYTTDPRPLFQQQ
jgi:general secretion pathway protein D